MTVLLVDDDELFLVLIQRALNEVRVPHVSAHSVDEAFSALAANDIDIMITDINLQDRLDGYELASEACAKYDGLMVIYMSGKRADRSFSPPISGPSLQKPVGREEIQQCVQTIMAS